MAVIPQRLVGDLWRRICAGATAVRRNLLELRRSGADVARSCGLWRRIQPVRRPLGAPSSSMEEGGRYSGLRREKGRAPGGRRGPIPNGNRYERAGARSAKVE